MSLRARLLLTFVSIALVVVGLFGSVAYKIAKDSEAQNFVSLIHSFAVSEAQDYISLLKEDSSPANIRSILDGRGDKELQAFFIDGDGKIIANTVLMSLFGSDFTASPWTEFNEAGKDFGKIYIHGDTYFWNKINIESLSYQLVLVHHKTDLPISPIKQVGTKLLITAFIVVWIAAWGALILSSLIIKGIENKNREIEHQAQHDSLTGLLNRVWLGSHMNEILLKATKRKSSVAILVMDLDRFKEINDTLGHDSGDELLKHVAGRIKNAIQETDIVIRLGGDEFAIIMPDGDPSSAMGCVGRILRSMEAPVKLAQAKVDAKISIGISFFPDHGGELNTLIRRSEVAMYEAKLKNSGYAIYHRDNDPYNIRRLTLLSDLNDAVNREQLSLLFQPKVEIANGRIIGAEALIRWNHPELGSIPPNEFIPLAEHGGMIQPITLWVMSESLRQQAQWRDNGIALNIAINISAKNLQDSGFPRQLAELMKVWNASPESVELEITESAVMLDPTQALAILAELHSMKIRLSIDDFGTGYSSLAYIKKLPVDTIKIDRSFVMDMENDSNDEAIVRATVGMAHSLGLKVVAEGIETLGAWKMLEEMGCDIAQGYFISRPLPFDQLSAFLTTWSHQSPISLGNAANA